MSSSVRRAVVDAIRDHGPISFAEYMELALYGPGGYYASPRIGAGGDFVTSPHIHPVFGRLVGAALRQLHAELGAPSGWRVVEVGAGDGTLARQILGELDDARPIYEAVERSEAARGSLVTVEGIAAVQHDLRPTAGPCVILAHELLDNLPFRRLRGTAQGVMEVRVGLQEGDLFEVLSVPEPNAVSADLEPGEEIVVPQGALAFVDRIPATLQEGYALLIDYGSLGPFSGPTHGYRDHGVVADVLSDPGSTDVTAGVDFELVARHAEAAGLTAFPSVTQRRALTALGFGDWAHEERDRQTALLAAGEGADAVRAWGARSRATLLVDPSGLGRFRWLLLATPGLPAPPWLSRALDDMD
jgi:SAM-dependent MidA family methyltransferase